MTDTTQLEHPTQHGGLPARVLLIGAIALSTGFQLAVFLIGLVVASDEELHGEQGVIASLQSITVVAAVALVLAFAVSLWARSTPSRARFGAVLLGALSVVSLPAFWAGAPAIFGANAAWVGGLTRGATPMTGAARGFAITGLVMSVLDVVALVVLTGGHVLTHGY
jgi:hypothetical protein